MGKEVDKELCVLGFLGGNAWMDIKKQQISLLSAVVFAVIGIGMSWYSQNLDLESFIPLCVGVLFLCISVMTRGELGMGDGILLLALGTMLSLDELLVLLVLAMAGCGVYSGFLLLVRKKNRHTRIPFLPFLLAGYAGGLLLW
jgi:leader peptidase (prepilin peptidase)/N-methyltransferase